MRPNAMQVSADDASAAPKLTVFGAMAVWIGMEATVLGAVVMLFV